jgi:Tropinone reductase 1
VTGWDLNGKTALVTGGTKGIGRAICDELAALGAHVIVVARTHVDVDATAAELHGTGIAADVVTERAKIVAAITGPLHILVHDAATNVRKPLVQYDDATWNSIIATNLTSAILLSRDLYPRLCEARGASVIHVGSVAGQLALPTGVAYAAAKAGLEQAARTLALEWARDQIRVNTVAPWYTRTPLAQPVLDRPDVLAAIEARTPLGRVAEPREIATAVAFLALPVASYITGQCLNVDGGMSIQGLGNVL